MSDPRPNFTLTRCCKTCHYYKQNGHAHNNEYEGVCSLEQVVDPAAEPRPTFTAMVCDAHTWKAKSKILQRWAVKSGANIPDEIL